MIDWIDPDVRSRSTGGMVDMTVNDRLMSDNPYAPSNDLTDGATEDDDYDHYGSVAEDFACDQRPSSASDQTVQLRRIDDVHCDGRSQVDIPATVPVRREVAAEDRVRAVHDDEESIADAPTALESLIVGSIEASR